MSAPNHPQRLRAIFMLLLANVYWGISFPIIKALTSLTQALVPEAGTWFLAAGALAPRFLLATVVLLVFQRWRRPTALEYKQGLIIALFASGGSLLQTDALQFTAASTSAFLTQLTAILIPTVVAIRYWRNPGVVIWAACVLVLVGVALLSHVSFSNLRLRRGEWETMLCSVFFTGQILWLGRSEFAGNRPEVVTLLMFAAEAAVFLGLAGLAAPRWGALLAPWQSVPWVGLSLVLAVVCTIGAFGIMVKWQPLITSTEAGLIYCVEPVFASIFALFLPGLISLWAGLNYLNETATWALIVGGGLVTVANVLIQFDAVKAEKVA
jgi:drug/metabolite transporter (DMT)-like permease